MNSFNEMELHPQILKGVDAAGFGKPFPIQERAIGPLLAGMNEAGHESSSPTPKSHRLETDFR